MLKTDEMPMWVFFALSVIETRNTALLLVFVNVLFTAYCVPWVTLYSGIDWIATWFVVEDWAYFFFSALATLWYWLSLRWVDKHQAWPISETEVA